MSNILEEGVQWVEKEVGIAKADVVAIEPVVVSWASGLLAKVTPVIKQAVMNGVMAAVSVPGSGEVKAAAAFMAASAELLTAGVPIVDNDLKALIQIGYNSLPSSVTGNAAASAVVAATDNAVDSAAAKVEAAAPASA